MLAFLLRRLALKALLVVLATSLAYLLASVALDPAQAYRAQNRSIPASVVAANLNTYNVDPAVPLPERYARWAGGIVLHGDFGKVFRTQETVTSEMGRRIGVSLRLLLPGTVLAVLLGVVVGAYGALRQYRPSDHAVTVVSFVLLSTPVFLLANALKYLGGLFNSAVGSTVLYSDGEYHTGPHAGLLERTQHLVLPTLALMLGSAGIAYFSRYQRSAMLDVLGSDFLRTARAKGLTRGQAFWRHGLRTALIPMATFFAFTFGLLVTGATFLEQVFNWNGMGQWAVDSISNADVNSVAAITAFVAVMVLLSSVLADLAQALLDPRLRTGDHR